MRLNSQQKLHRSKVDDQARDVHDSRQGYAGYYGWLKPPRNSAMLSGWEVEQNSRRASWSFLERSSRLSGTRKGFLMVKVTLLRKGAKRELPVTYIYNRYTIGLSSGSVSIPIVSSVLNPNLLNFSAICSWRSAYQYTFHSGYRTVSMPYASWLRRLSLNNPLRWVYPPLIKNSLFHIIMEGPSVWDPLTKD